jgi:hypothetical protein
MHQPKKWEDYVTSRSGALRHLFFEDTCSQVIWTLFDVGPYIFDYDVIDR